MSADANIYNTGTTGRNPEELQADIERTRERMSENIDVLGERLSPDRLKAEARNRMQEAQHVVSEKVRGKMRDVATGVGDQARESGSGFFNLLRRHPVPTAMIGTGAAWLALESRRRPADYAYDTYGDYYQPEYQPERYEGGGYAAGSPYSETLPESSTESGGMTERTAHAAGATREKVGEAAHRASEKADDLAHRAGERADRMRSTARERSRRTRDQVNHTFYENPLVMGAAVLTFGAAVGSLLPRTRREDEMMGERRDQLMEKAAELKDVAREAAGQATESVKEEAAYYRGAAGETARELQADLKTSAKKVAEDVKETARTEADERGITGR